MNDNKHSFFGVELFPQGGGAMEKSCDKSRKLSPCSSIATLFVIYKLFFVHI